MKDYYVNFQKTQYEDISIKFDCIKSVEARYIKQSDPMDQGNDLIEALIPLKNYEDSLNSFERRPYISSHERNYSSEDRMIFIHRLDYYRISRDYIPLIDMEIGISLRRCYRARKKFNLDKIKTLDETGKYFTDCEYKKIEGEKTQGFTIIGISGGGKTTAHTSLFYNYPQTIIHTDENSRCMQIVYIKVECPADGSLKSFYNSCLDAMANAVGKEIDINKDKMTIGEKERLFKKLALRWNLGIIVIEEIQQLSIKRQETMNQFLTLANDTQIPMVFVGTYKAVNEVFGGNLRLTRRLGNEIRIDRYMKGPLWDDMIHEIWEYQWLKEYIPLTQELKDVFYDESAGVIDRVINLFEAVQLDAILVEKESEKYITSDYIRYVSIKYFPTTRDVLYGLSTGTYTEEKWDDIYDKKVDKDSVQAIANQLEQVKVAGLILDESRKKENLTMTSLRNNIITNIIIFLKDKYSIVDIEKAFDYLIKKHKKKLVDMDETLINGMILDLLANPDKMNRKPQKEKRVYDLPRLEDLLENI
jgi:hypothetical protein